MHGTPPSLLWCVFACCQPLGGAPSCLSSSRSLCCSRSQLGSLDQPQRSCPNFRPVLCADRQSIHGRSQRSPDRWWRSKCWKSTSEAALVCPGRLAYTPQPHDRQLHSQATYLCLAYRTMAHTGTSFHSSLELSFCAPSMLSWSRCWRTCKKEGSSQRQRLKVYGSNWRVKLSRFVKQHESVAG